MVKNTLIIFKCYYKSIVSDNTVPIKMNCLVLLCTSRQFILLDTVISAYVIINCIDET